MANFESFDRRMASSQTRALVTIQKRGTLSLNRTAYEAIDSPGSVELLYDREAGVIGLRAVDHDQPNAYHVRAATPSPNGPWVVSAIAFTKHYRIDTIESLRWEAYLEGAILCIDLSTPGQPVTSNRARKNTDL